MTKYTLIMAFAFFLFIGMSSDSRSSIEIPIREFLIIYSGNTLGELKPCGCAKEEDQGGFERRMTYLKEVSAKVKNILLVDTGDSFKEPSLQGKIKANYILKAMSKLMYDAVIPGEKDLIYGETFLENKTSIPWVLSNGKLGNIIIPDFRVKKFANGLTIAMLGIADPSLYYSAKHNGGKVTDPKESVKKLISKLKKSNEPDLILLLTHMKRKQAVSLLALDGVDIVVNGHIEKDTDLIDTMPLKKDGKIFIQPGPRGQKMGELNVRIDSKGNKLFEQRMVRLGSNLKSDSEMVTWYKEYNSKVEDLFFASLDARKNQHKRKKVYASEKTCLICHPSKHEIWNKSNHSRAYATLKRANKAFDPDCLKCHVTGFGLVGGFISEVDTPKLKNVQCEVCHGPMLKHSKNPQAGSGKNALNACKLCHVKNHSPSFNFFKYWEKIKH